MKIIKTETFDERLLLKYELSRGCRIPFLLGALLVFGLLSGMSLVVSAHEIRSIDGTGNNISNPQWGSAGIPLLRMVDPSYADGIDDPPVGRPGPRDISNQIMAQTASHPNPAGATDFVWQWGQFIDHDIDLTGPAVPLEAFPIPIPVDDPVFIPGSEMPFFRSLYDPLSQPREQINEITAFLDGSMVYGSDPGRALALRTNDGTGRLKVSKKGLLPFNIPELPNAPSSEPTFFLAGDVRANEVVTLTAMHTLFVREHNRLARQIKRRHQFLTGDQIYEQAWALVGAEIQAITFKEFLPVLLGPNALEPYQGYDPDVDPGISNIFSTAAYRFGHSMLNETLLRLKKNGKPIKAGNLQLRDAFFSPAEIIENRGIEPLLRGLASQPAQNVDVLITNGVRNFLFGEPPAHGLDLASLNIQRGRDHGLGTCNDVRIAFGLSPVSTWGQITSNEQLQEKLSDVYGNVEDVDAWVCGLAEDHYQDALVGELVFTVLKDQFDRLRHGDRFWYQNRYSGQQRRFLKRTTLAKIIRRNTKIGHEIQNNVFLHK